MSFNNILPAWLLLDLCPKCGQAVKPRKDHPGVFCTECGGECILEKELDIRD